MRLHHATIVLNYVRVATGAVRWIVHRRFEPCALRFLSWRFGLTRAELDACDGCSVRLRVRHRLVETAVEMFNVCVTAHAI